MPINAVCLLRSFGWLADPSQHINLVRDRFKVCRIEAANLTAQMVKLASIWHRTIHAFP